MPLRSCTTNSAHYLLTVALQSDPLIISLRVPKPPGWTESEGKDVQRFPATGHRVRRSLTTFLLDGLFSARASSLAKGIVGSPLFNLKQLWKSNNLQTFFFWKDTCKLNWQLHLTTSRCNGYHICTDTTTQVDVENDTRHTHDGAHKWAHAHRHGHSRQASALIAIVLRLSAPPSALTQGQLGVWTMHEPLSPLSCSFPGNHNSSWSML